jgi:hypothetical protein
MSVASMVAGVAENYVWMWHLFAVIKGITVGGSIMRAVSPHRDISHHAMPYCPGHHRLFPNVCVDWLTPASIEGLSLILARCPRYIKEAQRDDILQYAWPIVSSPAASVDQLKN